ncbi:MAG: hypothetical protein HY075_13820 [Deltaproteobacteria bacterium]|nr:hypothetical protein [Deltaproteobacteria bacterium]
MKSSVSIGARARTRSAATSSSCATKRPARAPEHARTVWRASPSIQGFIESETTRWENGKPVTTTTLLPQADADRCEQPNLGLVAVSTMGAFVGGLRKAAPDFGDEFEGFVPLGGSFSASPKCAPHQQLGEEIQAALQTGYSCLQSLGQSNPRWRKEATRLRAVLDKHAKPVRLYCGKGGEPTARVLGKGRLSVSAGEVARAITPDASRDAPGVQFNSEAMKERSPRERQGAIFHELLHLIGFKHGEGDIDLPYLANYCCFARAPDGKFDSADPAALKNDSCALLKNKNLKADSNEYIDGFMKVMARTSKEDFGYWAAIEAAARNHRLGAPVDGMALAHAAFTYRASDEGFLEASKTLEAIYLNAAKRNVSGSNLDLIEKNYQEHVVDGMPEAKLKLVDTLGALLSADLNKDGGAFAKAYADLNAMSPAVCSSLSADDGTLIRISFAGAAFRGTGRHEFNSPPLDDFCRLSQKK